MRYILPLVLSLIGATVSARSESIPKTSPYGRGWKKLAPIASGPRQEHAVAAIDGRVYIIAGVEANRTGGFFTTNRVEVYHTRRDIWTEVESLPVALNHANAVSIHDKIYVVGALSGGDIWRAVPNIYRYDPSQNRWTELAPMPNGTERGSAVVAVQGTSIYLAGGMRALDPQPGGYQDTVDTVSSYDTETGRWTALPSLPRRRDHAGGAIVNGTFYVLGGRDRGKLNFRDTVFALDLRAPSGWTKRATLPTARGGFATAVVRNQIYVFGGEGNPANGSRGVFPQNEVYDVCRNRWRRLAPMPTPRHGTGAVTIDDTIHIPGGGDAIGGAPVAVNDAYRPRS